MKKSNLNHPQPPSLQIGESGSGEGLARCRHVTVQGSAVARLEPTLLTLFSGLFPEPQPETTFLLKAVFLACFFKATISLKWKWNLKKIIWLLVAPGSKGGELREIPLTEHTMCQALNMYCLKLHHLYNGDDNCSYLRGSL